MGCGTEPVEEKPEQNKDDLNINPPPDKFADMPLTNKPMLVGYGIKQVHNYICTLPLVKLRTLRDEFWEIKVPQDPVYKILRKCIENSPEKAEKILSENNICVVMTNGLKNIQETYVKSNPDVIYKIPNFVICDPIFIRDYEQFEQIYDAVEDVNLEIILACKLLKKQYNTKLRFKSTGLDVKHKFFNLSGVDKRVYNIKLFYNNIEICDTHCLFYHSISNDATIEVVLNERGDTVETYSNSKTRKAEIRARMKGQFIREGIENKKMGLNEEYNYNYEDMKTEKTRSVAGMSVAKLEKYNNVEKIVERTIEDDNEENIKKNNMVQENTNINTNTNNKSMNIQHNVETVE